MTGSPNIARVAALIGDNARAAVLSHLMSDRAHTATELADVAGVTRQTISGHLAKLVDGGLLQGVRQGRHRYFRLASVEVAALLEALMGASRPGIASDVHAVRHGPRHPAMRKARTCYDHLAGELAVAALEALLQGGRLRWTEGALTLTPAGAGWFDAHGIAATPGGAGKGVLCQPCLDWSERRHHLAGRLGTALLAHVRSQRWARQQPESRIVTFSAAGEHAFRSLLDDAAGG